MTLDDLRRAAVARSSLHANRAVSARSTCSALGQADPIPVARACAGFLMLRHRATRLRLTGAGQLSSVVSAFASTSTRTSRELRLLIYAVQALTHRRGGRRLWTAGARPPRAGRSSTSSAPAAPCIHAAVDDHFATAPSPTTGVALERNDSSAGMRCTTADLLRVVRRECGIRLYAGARARPRQRVTH